MRLETKARTLINLAKIVRCASILPAIRVSYEQWTNSRQYCLAQIDNEFNDICVIVRSSCSREDSTDQSNAGAFLSVKDVSALDIGNAIDKVFASYKCDLTAEEVLIQPMLEDVVRAGVAFSHDPGTKSPYRVINYSDGPSTSEVTSGEGGAVWIYAARNPNPLPNQLQPVRDLLEELLSIFNQCPLDIEFAVTKPRTTSETSREVLWLLQVRKLHILPPIETEESQSLRLAEVYKSISRSMQPHPYLLGARTVYGVMPDWNPAEIIGLRPKPLSLSLYRELITDSIWAYQRNNYGYRNLRSFPLLTNFYGAPYIDVRVSLNSFIPSKIENPLAERLVEYYLDKLIKNPELHDKIEFEIVISCFTFDIDAKLAVLRDNGFSDKDCKAIKSSVIGLTNNILNSSNSVLENDLQKIDRLVENRDKILKSSLDDIGKIYWLIEDAKRYGTLPFAGLARAAFIAISLLESLVEIGILSETEKQTFLSTIMTVSSQIGADLKSLSRDEFLSKYGHLRPGTYDIDSVRYDEAPEKYFSDSTEYAPCDKQAVNFSLSDGQVREINNLLIDNGMELDADQLFEFFRVAIEWRERSKFQFTKNLSDVLSLIVSLGESVGLDREALSYLSVGEILELNISLESAAENLTSSINKGRKLYEKTRRMHLPPLITTGSDVWSFEIPKAQPNYITQKQVVAHVCTPDDTTRLRGAIVAVPSADPGYDWLFTYEIAGLITAWGGVNSHMAIRASELGVPAVLGAGELLFEQWSSARSLYLDCAGRRVEIIE